MPILLILVLAILGVATWAITTFIPMPAGYKKLIIVVSILLAIMWLLHIAGWTHYLTSPRI